MWPDWAIYWTLGKFLMHLAKNNLPKSPTFLGNFWKGVKIYQFYSEIILGNFYRHLAIFSGHTDWVPQIWTDIFTAQRRDLFPLSYLLQFPGNHVHFITQFPQHEYLELNLLCLEKKFEMSISSHTICTVFSVTKWPDFCLIFGNSQQWFFFLQHG